MGVSEVLLCPYRCLEYKMENDMVDIRDITNYRTVRTQIGSETDREATGSPKLP